MNLQQIDQILQETAYVRTGGSPEELKCAEYICGKCAELGLEARLEAFEVNMADIKTAKLIVDGQEVPCKGYKGAGSSEVEAPLYYLRNNDRYSLKQCEGKIVLIDTGLGRWMYQDLIKNGAVGAMTFDGHYAYADNDIDQKELRGLTDDDKVIPCVNVNVKSAMEMVRTGSPMVKIILEQDQYKGESHNVIVDIPGETDEVIIMSAHFDSTSLSVGSYDNMSGVMTLLHAAEYFAKNPARYSMRFVWCGSEERGLLGSKAYCAAHEAELEKVVLNVNIDMVGCIMGKFTCGCTTEEGAVHYIKYLADEVGFACHVFPEVWPSDSSSFADKGVPAITFQRGAPGSTACIHNRYDTVAVMKAEQQLEDMEFVLTFVKRMANATIIPIPRTIPDNLKEKLEKFSGRKR